MVEYLIKISGVHYGANDGRGQVSCLTEKADPGI